MPQKIMTTKELAEYIKLNEKTVIKMAQSGDLPGKKIGNQWRFQLMAIDNYLQDNIMKSSGEDLNTLIRTMETSIPLSRLTKPPLINLNLKSNQREEVLFEISKIACEAGLTPSIKILFEELKKREKMLSTAVGDGIAIPHPRHPSKKLFKTPNIVICRTQLGINFDAPDKKKVHLFFLICAPDVCIHLRLLAKVSKLLHAKDIIQKFMEADSGEEVIKILLEFERQVIYPI